MLDDEKILLEELKEKLKEVELRVDDLEESTEDDEQIIEEGFLQVENTERTFFVHWIDISETSFASCDGVNSVEDAQLAFKQAAEYRDSSSGDDREILHGDLMILLCNKTEDTDEETSESTYSDSCYYVGMCIFTDGLIQPSNPVPGLGIAESINAGSKTIKQFIAWYTCGSGELPPEEPCQESPKIFETVSNLNFDIETTGDDCKTIKFTLTGDVKKLTFACGKLIDDEDESPISIEKTIEVAGCKDCECECNEGAYPCISENDAFGKTVDRFRHNGTDWGTSEATETYDNWVTSENGCEGNYDQSTRGTYKVKYMASQNCEKYFSISIMMGWNGGTPDANGDVWEPVTNIVNGVYFPSNNHGTLDNPSFNDVKYVFS